MAREGFVTLFEWLATFLTPSSLLSTEATLEAISHGQVSILSLFERIHPKVLPEPFIPPIFDDDLDKMRKTFLQAKAVFHPTLIAPFAFAEGTLEVVRWAEEYLFHQREDWASRYSLNICLGAAQNRHIEVVRYLRATYDLHFDRVQLAPACRHGSIPLLEELRSYGANLSSNCYVVAAKFGHVHVFNWLKENDCPGPDHLAREAAIKFSQLLALKWLVDSGLTVGRDSLGISAIFGNYEIIDYLLTRPGAGHHNVDTEVYQTLVRYNHFETLKKVRNKTRKSFSHWTSRIAITYNRLEILEWLHENDCPIDFGTSVRVAALSGSIKVLDFLLSINCPLDPEAMVAAAGGGHFDALLYLAEKGCPWTERVLSAAFARGHMAIVSYYLQQKFPLSPEMAERLNSSTQNIADTSSGY